MKKSIHNAFKEKAKRTEVLFSFVLDTPGLESVSHVRKLLEDEGFSTRDARMLAFSLDTQLYDWFESGLEGATAELAVERVLWSRKLVLKVQGNIDNPEDITESAYVSSIMQNLCAAGLAWSITYTKYCAIAELSIPKKRMNAGKATLLAVACALATIAVCACIPGNTLESLTETIVNPLFDMGLGLLSALAGPLVFFSVVSSILGAGDMQKFKRIGSCVIKRIMQVNIFAIVLAIIAALVILRDNLCVANTSSDFSSELTSLIASIIPTSLIQPFIDGNILQILVWALLFGVGALLLNSRFRVLGDAINDLNILIQWAIEAIARFLPVFLYLSIIRLASIISPEAISSLLQLFIASVTCIVVFNVTQLLYAARKNEIAFRTLCKEMSPLIVAAFLTASSASCFSLSCETLKKFSVKDSLIQFHIPVGFTLNSPGIIIYFILMLATNATLEGISIGILQFVLLLFIGFALAVATPPIAGEGVALYAFMFSAMGFSATFLPLFIAIDLLFDMIYTTANVVGNATSCLHANRDLKEEL